MVQLNSWDRTEYPPDLSPGFDLDIKAALQSFSGRTIQWFASTAARDSAFAALTTAQQRNYAVCGVTGLGLFYWTGSVWRPIASDNTLVQSGLINVTPEVTGLKLIAFPVPFATGTTPMVMAQHATGSQNPPSGIKVYPYTAPGYIVNTHFHIYVANNGVAYGSGLDIMWMAHGVRAAE